MSFRHPHLADSLAERPANELRFSWDELDQLALTTAESIMDYYRRRHAKRLVILTFTRGGLWVTGLVSRHLKVKPIVLAIPAGEPPPVVRFDDSTTYHIVLDDILDTGKTMASLRGTPWELRQHFFLLNKPGPHREFTPDDWWTALDIPETAWAVFEWEHKA